jgi:hypothetical protein
VSRQKNSLVLVRPASRQVRTNGRPVFVVGINNFGKQPVDFRVSEVDARQHVGASDYGMQVVTFEMLVQEEKNRQVAAAILTGVAGAANSYSASRAGQGSYTTPGGRTGTFYSPTAAVIAQNNAAMQNEAMFAATVETGQRNMATLEQSVLPVPAVNRMRSNPEAAGKPPKPSASSLPVRTSRPRKRSDRTRS